MKKIIIAFFLLTMGSQLLAKPIPEYPAFKESKIGKEISYTTFFDGYVYKFELRDVKTIEKVPTYFSIEFYRYKEKFDKAPELTTLKPKNFERVAAGKWLFKQNEIQKAINLLIKNFEPLEAADKLLEALKKIEWKVYKKQLDIPAMRESFPNNYADDFFKVMRTTYKKQIL